MAEEKQYCPKCGEEITNNAEYCEMCGASLKIAKAHNHSKKMYIPNTIQFPFIAELIFFVLCSGGISFWAFTNLLTIYEDYFKLFVCVILALMIGFSFTLLILVVFKFNKLEKRIIELHEELNKD